MRFYYFIPVIFIFLSFNTTIAAASTNTDVQVISGDHYISARTGQSVMSKLTLKNVSKYGAVRIKAQINNPAFTIYNHCEAGLKPLQMCDIMYTYNPKKDSSVKHNGVVGQADDLQISYTVSSVTKTLTYSIVAMHLDSQRIIRIPNNLSQYHKLASGAMNDLYYDKLSNILYAATPAGLSISHDLAKGWYTLSPTGSSMNLGSTLPTAEYPQLVRANKENIFVVMRSPDDSVNRYHILVSNDHGVSWHKLKQAFYFVSAFLLDGNTLYISDGTDLYISKDQGKTWSTQRNINVKQFAITKSKQQSTMYLVKAPPINRVDESNTLYRSTDHGTSWLNVPLNTISQCKTSSDKTTQIKIDSLATANNAIYAGVECSNHTAFLLKSNDEGQHWQTLKSEPSNMWAKLSVKANNIITNVWGNYILSTDDGKTWQILKNYPTQDKNGINGMGGLVQLDVNNKKLLIIGTQFNGLNISADNGKSWHNQTASALYNHNLHLDYKVYVGAKGKTLIANAGQPSASSTKVSEDGGISWRSFSFPEYNNHSTFFYDGKVAYYTTKNIENNSVIMFKSLDLGKNWLPITLPKGNALLLPDRIFVNGADLYLTGWAFNNNKKLRLSTDHGVSWRDIDITGPDVPDQSDCSGSQLAESTNSVYFATECSEPKNGAGLYFSTKASGFKQWHAAFKNLAIHGVVANGNNVYVMTMTSTPFGQSNKAQLHISHDDGKTWKIVVVPNVQHKVNETRLLAVHNNIIYIAVPAESDDHYDRLQISKDDGTSWTNLATLNMNDNAPMINNITFSAISAFMGAGNQLFNLGQQIKPY